MEQYIDKYFPKLTFVGEEDTTFKIEYGDKYKFLTEITDLNLNLLSEEVFGMNEYDFADIKLFIDPIDATMDFIKKNYEVVTCLVGIVYKDQPLAGLVHYPYYEGKDKSVSFFNIPGKGIFEYETYTQKMEKLVSLKNPKFAFSCSKTKITPQIEQSKY